MERERVLNAHLRAFGLSLLNTIEDVLTIHEHPNPAVRAFTDDKKQLEEEKIEKIRVVPGNWKAALSLWIAELEREVDGRPKYNTYEQLTRSAYIHSDLQLSNHQLYLYEPFDTNHPKMTPNEHIKLCLAAIARGAKLAMFIPALKQEMVGTKVPGKSNQRPITAAAIALFCKAISETGINSRKAHESNANYCKRVCNLYFLNYTDRVRQAFSQRGTSVHAIEVAERIMPSLPNDIRAVRPRGDFL